MAWTFDQAQGVACMTCRSTLDAHSVLFVTHDEDDHSWELDDGAPVDPASVLVAAWSEVAPRYPDLEEIASLPPSKSATRVAAGEPWRKPRDEGAREA
ncbi:hypothetical protein GGR04_003702 [Aureimonas pseudogalii]|uniref:Uncharacterized protein n=1 Tax=Aureimonas pseudogalii TaxID=1744844 RepID=A0A7W6H777_9HYPH|nr:hypothetical protein [Aureimonas pseudogalii]